MKTKRSVGFTLACLSLFLFLAVIYQHSQAAPTATTYYVCDCQPGADGDCAAGNDANAGTDPAAPWQTYEKARTFYNSSIAAGDEILFCQGGAHDISSNPDNHLECDKLYGGPALYHCRITHHRGPLATKAAPFCSAATMGTALTSSTTAVTSSKIWTYAAPVVPAAAAGAFFIVEDADDILIDNVRMDGFTIGVHLRGCVATWCSNDRVTIRNSQITNNSGQGFLGSGTDLLIENNYFENNGDGTVFAHNIYVAGNSRVTIRNNELYRASLDGSG